MLTLADVCLEIPESITLVCLCSIDVGLTAISVSSQKSHNTWAWYSTCPSQTYPCSCYTFSVYILKWPHFRFIESVACCTLMYPGSISLSYAWTFCCISLWTEVTSSARLFQWQCESWLQVGHRDLLLSFSRKCSEQIFRCNQASQKNCNWSWSTQVHTSRSYPANSRPFSWECKVTRSQNR